MHTAIRRVDDVVGDMLQLLRDLKIEKDTLVIFSRLTMARSIESYLRENLAANFFDSFGPFDGIKRDLLGRRFAGAAAFAWWGPDISEPGGISTQPSQCA